MSHTPPIVDHARVTVMTFTSPPSLPLSRPWAGVSAWQLVRQCALAPLGLRIISPLTFYLSFLGAIWTYDKNLAPIFPSHLSTVAPQIFPDPRPPSQRKYM